MYTLDTPLPTQTFCIDVRNAVESKKVLKYLQHYRIGWCTGNPIDVIRHSTAYNKNTFFIPNEGPLHPGTNFLMFQRDVDDPCNEIRTNAINITEKFFGKPLTNEEVLTIFLKEHRKFASFKRQLIPEPYICRVDYCIDIGLHWTQTEEGYAYWEGMEDKFRKLCKDLRITGQIDLTKLGK